ncbi:MAG: amidohydrolase family protein [Armatimonadetes bacterium]|nr:amidohydrolase family protein [Armatimonadota bacterium]
MPLLLVNGMIVTGDGTTIIDEGSIVMENGLIREVVKGSRSWKKGAPGEQIIDGTGKLFLPGVINNHAHGTTIGPLNPTASSPLPLEQVLKNVDRHILEGTTTILNVDGFALPHEVQAIRDLRPVHLQTGTIHMPVNVKAADSVDGKGLTEAHRKATVEEMLKAGAVAICEIGGGGTLGGGQQDYLYIPNAIERETGVRLHPLQARKLKEAILSPYIDPNAYDVHRTAAVLQEIGLGGKITPDRARELVSGCVLPPYALALDGIREAAATAKKAGRVTTIHAAAATKAVFREIQEIGPLLVAAHCNHPSFKAEEAVEFCRDMNKTGVVIDISTVDGWGRRAVAGDAENFYAILRSGLCDTVSTDYAGGFHDAILLGLEKSIEVGAVTLPQAIAMATSNVVKAFPGLAPNAGEIRAGRDADVLVVDRDHVSRVGVVIISGRVVARDGRLVA